MVIINSLVWPKYTFNISLIVSTQHGDIGIRGTVTDFNCPTTS